MTTGASKKAAGEAGAGAQERLAAEMIKQAQEQGLALTGPEGLLGQLTKTVLETALEAEMTEHLGHAKHADQPGREGTNVRNGAGTKMVVSDSRWLRRRWPRRRSWPCARKRSIRPCTAS